MTAREFPFSVVGHVVKGFGRGSRELGIPTETLPEAIVSGIYFGLSQIEGDDTIYPMCMSIGWNPYYKNEKRSAETHLIHNFESDFYGKQLRVLVLGHLRDEMNFAGIDELVLAIRDDIKKTSEMVLKEEYMQYWSKERTSIFN